MALELEEIVDDIEEVEDSRLIGLAVKPPSRPKKPSKKGSKQKQEFKQPLPPSIPEQIQKSKFRFDTTPFREDIQASTPEELGRRRSLMEAARRGIPSVRGATPDEARQLRSIQEEQDLYDKFGPLYTLVREGGSKLGTSIAAPFQSTYGDTARVAAGLAEDRSLEDIRKENLREEEARQAGPGRYVIKRGGYDPLKLERAIPYLVDIVGQALIGPKGGGKVGPRVGAPPEIGGVSPKMPTQIGSGRIIEGQPPTPPSRPIPPSAPLQLRQGRTIVGFPPATAPVKPSYMPPGPGDLARLSPGRMGPLGDMGLVSQIAPRDISGLIPDDNTFDLLPALKPGQAPVMIVPPWVIGAATGSPADKFGGVNFRLEDIPWLKNQLIMSSPSIEHQTVALEAISDLVKASEAEGINTISIVAQGVTPKEMAEIIPHETFHAGQTQAAGTSAWDLHDPAWARNHPVIQAFIANNPMMVANMKTSGSLIQPEDMLATELPTYVAAGQSDYHFPDLTSGTDFLYQYFEHVAQRHGANALDVIGKTARLLPETQEILKSARSTYESYERELSQSRTPIEGGGQQGGVVRGISKVASGGSEPRGNQEEIGRVDSEVGGVSATGLRKYEGEARRLAYDNGLDWDQLSRYERQDYIDEARKIWDRTNFEAETQPEPVSEQELLRRERESLEALDLPQRPTREIALEGFLRDSVVKVPVYHGTQSPTEIERIDPSKFDPDALYGPGFYATQSSDVAAGEGGYVETTKGRYQQPSTMPGPFGEDIGFMEDIGKPHAYKVYLDIKKPFDIDGPIGDVSRFQGPLTEWLGDTAYVVLNRLTPQTTGSELYSMLSGFENERMDKTEITQMLQEMGFDGITHIGGILNPPKWFQTEMEARTFADQTGGDLMGPSNIPFQATGPNGEQWMVKGHKVWIAFRPEQVKSATGNIGTFDPSRPEMSLSTTSPVKEGEIVKVKGYSNEAEVTQLLPGGGVEVKFPDGTVDQFDFDQVTKVAPKATPKVQESNEKLVALQKESIVSNANDPRQLSLPGIEAPSRMIAEPPIPPSNQPPLPGIGPERPSIFREAIKSEYTDPVVTGLKALLKSGGIKEDPTLRPFLQVRKALLEGRIQPKGFAQLLEENGLTIEDYANEYEETASEAGRILQQLSETTREDLQIVKMIKEDPEMAKLTIPAKRRMEAILRDIEATQLGKNFLQRGGDVVQQLMLGDLSIAMRNALTTVGRIPVMAGTQMVGTWIKHVHQGAMKGKSLEEMWEGARNDAFTGLESASEMLAALTPPMLRRYLRLAGRGEQATYKEAITQLEKAFPDLHRELVTPGFGPEAIETDKKNVEIARDIMMEMRVDVKKRDEFVKRLDIAERRLQRNTSLLGKALTKAGYPLDALMAPMNWAEMFFRRPAFYGHLSQRLHLEGIDLAEMIREDKFKEIPEDILKDAIDEALYVTHAYMPRRERGRMEAGARSIIMALNQAKWAAPLTKMWFPRALYNGLKFANEYVPLTPLIGGVPFGMIRPVLKAARPKYATDPKTGKQIHTNPLENRDYMKIASGIIGTVLYVAAEWFLDSEYAGPEWYQMKSGKTGKDGQPVYWDLRGYLPLSLFLRIADLNQRARRNLLNDIDYAKELGEAITGIQKTSAGVGEWLNSMMDLFGGEEGATIEKAKVEAGRQLIAPITKPFVNIRNAWAGFSEDENKRKDLKGTGILGPAIDNVPWLRRSLPDVELMTQEGPAKLSEYPLAAMGGFRLAEGENFAGREWRRLGLYNKTFMNPDPDPIINRAQNEMFRTLVSGIGVGLEDDPSYSSMSDVDKAATWERFLRGIAARSSKYGLTANPEEANKRAKRQQLRESGIGPLQEKSLGLDELLKEMSPKK